MLKKTSFNFPFILEILIWIFYVAFYKYSYFLESVHLPRIPNNDFPYLEICLYAICITLCLVPYYRWAVPKLLQQKRYGWLFILTAFVFVFLMPYLQNVIAWVFEIVTRGWAVHPFFDHQFNGFFLDWNLILTDSIAFLCISFSRFSYQSEQLRHQIEMDHLQLQLSQLKSQLQPHFLFNTLNSLYGMSLTGSKETPRFILLLSQMMQYILYDCNNEKVTLKEELIFLQGYFEIEQKKFPGAKIYLEIADDLPDITVPPLLYLPLVENSFKHGRHRFEDGAGVVGRVAFYHKTLSFSIANERVLVAPVPHQSYRGGIGLSNIRQRLELYYPKNYVLSIDDKTDKYVVNLDINLT